MVVAPAGRPVDSAVHESADGLVDVLVGEAEEARHAQALEKKFYM